MPTPLALPSHSVLCRGGLMSSRLSGGGGARPGGFVWWGAADVGGLFLDGRVVLDARAGRQRRRRQRRARGRARAHAAQGVALFVSLTVLFDVCLFLWFLDFTPHAAQGGSRLETARSDDASRLRTSGVATIQKQPRNTRALSPPRSTRARSSASTGPRPRGIRRPRPAARPAARRTPRPASAT